MAAFDSSRTHHGAAPVAAHIGSVFLGLSGILNAWNDARITRKSLGKLSDRELDDIGLTRADIEAVASRR